MTSNLKDSVYQPIILGSGSFTRKMILKEANIPFDIVKADIDERSVGDRSSADKAKDLVLLLANAKADAILSILPDHFRGRLLLTADQVVTCQNQILEKPLTPENTRNYIHMYKNHPCSTVGSIVLTDTITRKRVSGVDTATIYFKEIPDHVIDQLIEEEMVMQCAGGLMIEHSLIQEYILRVDGELDSVMGLSKTLFFQLMKQMNE